MSIPVTNCPIELAALAGLYGVHTTYLDVRHETQTASPETLQAVLCALGVPLDSLSDASSLIGERRTQLAQQAIEPVIVAWNGKAPAIDVSLPAAHSGQELRCRLRSEDGAETAVTARQRVVSADELTDDEFMRRLAQSDGVPPGRRSLAAPGFVTVELAIEREMEPGDHVLTVETPGAVLTTCIISAPDRAFENPDVSPRRWGCFLPLYALHTGRDWGSGDFHDLANLRRWVRGLGGEMTATLPLLAAFLDEPCDPSPYAPASRLFWNEFYVAPEKTPEFGQCEAAQRLFSAADFQASLSDLRAMEYVDYRAVMSRKRQVLSLLAGQFFTHGSSRFPDYEQFAQSRPRLRDYAEFRATCERRRENWQRWPDRMRDGQLSHGDYDEAAAAYHCYVQWIANEQLGQLSSGGEGIDLDLPLGVRLDGYDVWRNRDAYASDAAAGAPPDAFFTKGQNWGFAPLHPDGIRRDRYRHVREFLTHHMERASTLRLDHVMNLRRLYWIPHGFAASEGVYVRYPMDELLAVLCLESHRHRTMLVGENLGTVPPEVNEAMDRRGLRTMFVVQYESGSKTAEPLKQAPESCVASLNTHDMPTFAAWWGGEDIADRHDLGLLTEQDMQVEHDGRAELRQRLADALLRAGWILADDHAQAAPANAGPVIRGLLRYLAASPAEMVLVNLEDLWQETRPQNIPGTHLERPNWRRKTRMPFEEFRELDEVQACLAEIDRLRRTEAP